MPTSIPESALSRLSAPTASRPRVVRVLRRRPAVALLLAFLLTCLVLALCADWLGLKPPEAIDASHTLSPPSWQYPMGTDYLGRSIFSRVIYGVRVSMLLSIASISVAAAMGTGLGLIAGYKRGLLDGVLMRVMDVLFCFPVILMAILIAAVIGPGVIGATIAIIVATVPTLTRVLRAATLSQAQRDYITAAIVSGARGRRILLQHLLPNVLPNLLVQTTYCLSVAMLIEGGLSFLGVGVQPPTASLGSVLRDGTLYVGVSPWGVLFPGVTLAAIILAVNLLGDALHETIDPRLKRRA